jgi:hypothetical protein
MMTVSSSGEEESWNMAKAGRAHAVPHKSYSKRISDHVAYALVVYTLMLIFVVTPAMESNGTSILPYFLLVVFVALLIPPYHKIEKKWQALQKADVGDSRLDTQFNVDRAKLWLSAILIPIGMAVAMHGLAAVA